MPTLVNRLYHLGGHHLFESFPVSGKVTCFKVVNAEDIHGFNSSGQINFIEVASFLKRISGPIESMATCFRKVINLVVRALISACLKSECEPTLTLFKNKTAKERINLAFSQIKKDEITKGSRNIIFISRTLFSTTHISQSRLEQKHSNRYIAIYASKKPNHRIIAYYEYLETCRVTNISYISGSRTVNGLMMLQEGEAKKRVVPSKLGRDFFFVDKYLANYPTKKSLFALYILENCSLSSLSTLSPTKVACSTVLSFLFRFILLKIKFN
jgi:hypothetical protein